MSSKSQSPKNKVENSTVLEDSKNGINQIKTLMKAGDLRLSTKKQKVTYASKKGLNWKYTTANPKSGSP